MSAMQRAASERMGLTDPPTQPAPWWQLYPVRGCRLTACDAPRGFAWEWPHATHTSLATVAVEPAGDQARLRVTHARLSASSVAGYTAGWDVYVRRLDDEVAGRAVADTWDSDWGRAYEGYAGQLD